MKHTHTQKSKVFIVVVQQQHFIIQKKIQHLHISMFTMVEMYHQHLYYNHIQYHKYNLQKVQILQTL